MSRRPITAVRPAFEEWQPGPWRQAPTSPEMDPEINPLFVRHAAALARDRGVDAASLWQGLSFSLQDIANPTFRLRYTQASEAIRRLALTLQSPDIGFLLGHQHHLFSWGLIALGAMASGTLEQAIEFGVAHQRAAGAMLNLRLRQDENDISLVASPILSDIAIERILVECMFTAVMRAGTHILGSPPKLRVVELVSPRVASAELYHAVFGCPVLFQQAENRLVAHAGDLRQPIGMSYPAARQNAVTLLLAERNAPHRLGPRIERLLLDTLPQPPTMQALARQFELSERTLRRRLMDEGCPYQDLLDAVRRTKGLELLLLAQRPPDDVARDLGLGDVRTLSRAMQRWTGLSLLPA